jgi:hypothetical protein
MERRVQHLKEMTNLADILIQETRHFKVPSYRFTIVPEIVERRSREHHYTTLIELHDFDTLSEDHMKMVLHNEEEAQCQARQLFVWQLLSYVVALPLDVVSLIVQAMRLRELLKEIFADCRHAQFPDEDIMRNLSMLRRCPVLLEDMTAYANRLDHVYTQSRGMTKMTLEYEPLSHSGRIKPPNLKRHQKEIATLILLIKTLLHTPYTSLVVYTHNRKILFETLLTMMRDLNKDQYVKIPKESCIATLNTCSRVEIVDYIK